MSAKTQHNNILLAILGIVAVVAIVAVIGLFAFGHTDEEIQGEVEVTEYRVSRCPDVFSKYELRRATM